MLTLKNCLARICAGAFITAVAASVAPAHAQSQYPDKPIRLVVPFPAGGTPDTLSRILGEHVGKTLKQSVIIENRGGAGGNIGAQNVIRSAADGYSLLVCTFSCSVAQFLYTPKPYDVVKDMDPVLMLGTVPSVLVVNPKVPVKTVRELLAYAKSNPGKLNAASSGVGGSAHMALELLKTKTGVDIAHVPYKGAGAVAADLLSGQVDMYFDNLPASLQSIRAGRLRAVAVASAERAAAIPDVPTFAESGVADLMITPWFGLMAPAGTPKDILARLNGAFNAALKDPAVVRRLEELGLVIAGGTPDTLERFVKTDSQRWAEVIKRNNIKSE
jgi:tripartite-type tricarboxylate transporter receptor subunit TctC